jgi:hypothetical protein
VWLRAVNGAIPSDSATSAFDGPERELARDLDLPVGEAEALAERVVAESRGRRRGGRGGGAAAQVRAHTRHQLHHAERLRDVVVGAEAEAAHLVGLQPAGAEDEHRGLAAPSRSCSSTQ